MAKDAYYFSHDSNAHKDPKVLKLRVKYGWEGYGIYWAIVETLREQSDYRWLASDKQLLSFCFASGEELVNQVIDACLEVGLLIDDGEYIYSESLSRRMKMKDEISEMRREAGRKGGQAKAKQTASKDVANAKANPSNKSKVNESKEKESKNKHAEFVSLLPSEFQKLIDAHGEETTKRMIEILDNYKGASGTTYKSDYRAILSWVVKKISEDRNKVTQLRSKQEPQGRAIPTEFNFDLSAGED